MVYKKKHSLHKHSVAIVGFGYIGQRLARQLSESCQITAFDKVSRKETEFSRGDVEQLHVDILKDRDEFDLIFFCLPTYANRQLDAKIVKGLNAKDLSDVVRATEHINAIKVICSTVDVKFTDIHDNDIVYMPERVDPQLGGDNDCLERIVGCDDPEVLIIASDLIESIFSDVQLHKATSSRVAVLTKIFENSFRLVNIAFANEFKNANYYDAEEVIRLAATKPFGFMPFYPNYCAGGHCIAEDPAFILSEMTPILNQAFVWQDRFPEIMAREFNAANPERKHVLVLGISYKKNSSETRNSGVVKFMSHVAKSHRVCWHDPFVKTEFPWSQISVAGSTIMEFDSIVVGTLHDFYHESMLTERIRRHPNVFDPFNQLAAV